MAFAELNYPGLTTTYLKEDKVIRDGEHADWTGLIKDTPSGISIAILALCK